MTNPAATQRLPHDEGDNTLRLAHGLRALAGVLLVGGVLTAIVLDTPTGTFETQRPAATASEPASAPTAAPETRPALSDEELQDRNPVPPSIVVG